MNRDVKHASPAVSQRSIVMDYLHHWLCFSQQLWSIFSLNPSFCPSHFWSVPGKEHLIEVNEDLGLYFNDCPAKEEDYDAPHVDVDAMKENLKENSVTYQSNLGDEEANKQFDMVWYLRGQPFSQVFGCSFSGMWCPEKALLA